jgi:engulfment and cell motility protein 1
MSSHTIEDLTSSLLDFQNNMLRVTYRRKTSAVDPHAAGVQVYLHALWAAAHLDDPELPALPDDASEVNGVEGNHEKWVKLGFESENLRAEFSRVGLLGLDCLVNPLFHLLFDLDLMFKSVLAILFEE